MTSEQFVWVWLPGEATPVVCGRVWAQGSVHLFQYARSYRQRPTALPLYGIPLAAGAVEPPAGLRLHGVLRDALPDAWGQHVILSRLTGLSGTAGDTVDLAEITYMRESASDRFGALDFQDSSEVYAARSQVATLEDLAGAAAALEEGRRLSAELDAALTHATSIGGARPKATLIGEGTSWIAKFSSSSDGGSPRVRHEALGLELSRRCGVDTVDFRLTSAAGRDALLVRRFDRDDGGSRLMTVSALTMLNLDEMAGRYATYPDLLDVLRTHGAELSTAGPELFRRIAVNIVVGNTDDHARNHAAFWDGQSLRLTPAYDIDPCRTPGWDANQAMAYGRQGERVSSLAALLATAAVYGLTTREARSVIESVVTAIRDNWDEALDVVRLTLDLGNRVRFGRYSMRTSGVGAETLLSSFFRSRSGCPTLQLSR